MPKNQLDNLFLESCAGGVAGALREVNCILPSSSQVMVEQLRMRRAVPADASSRPPPVGTGRREERSPSPGSPARVAPALGRESPDVTRIHPCRANGEGRAGLAQLRDLKGHSRWLDISFQQ